MPYPGRKEPVMPRGHGKPWDEDCFLAPEVSVPIGRSYSTPRESHLNSEGPPLRRTTGHGTDLPEPGSCLHGSDVPSRTLYDLRDREICGALSEGRPKCIKCGRGDRLGTLASTVRTRPPPFYKLFLSAHLGEFEPFTAKAPSSPRILQLPSSQHLPLSS